MTLIDINSKYKFPDNTDKGDCKSYLQYYNEKFSVYRKRCVFCEIGVALGYSFRLWDEYFSDECVIYGVDMHLEYVKTELAKNFSKKVRFLNCNVRDLSKTILSDIRFDIVVDDASHHIEDQIATLDFFLPRMHTGGIIVIEDVQTEKNADELVKRGGSCIRGRVDVCPDDRMVVYLCH
jgi:hypothetical protein